MCAYAAQQQLYHTMEICIKIDFFLKKVYLIFNYVSVLEYVCMYACSTCGGERRISDPLKLKTTGNCEPPNIVLETEFETSARSVCSLNC